MVGGNESCQADLNGKTVFVEYVNDQQIRVDAKLKDGDVLEVYRKGLYRIIGNTLQITEKEINYKWENSKCFEDVYSISGSSVYIIYGVYS